MGTSERISPHLVDRKALEEIISNLGGLDETQKNFLKKRWLRQVLWWDTRARQARWKYYAFRSVAAVGSVIIPALVGLNVNDPASVYIRWITFSLGLLVAISLALNELFHFGEIWREKRDAAELLKVEGWLFFQLSGKYKGKDYKEAYSQFADQVETMIEREIKSYIAVVQEHKQDEKK